MLHRKIMPLVALLIAALVSACSAPVEDVGSTQEALTPASIDMWAVHTLAAPPPGFTGIYTISGDENEPRSYASRVQVSPNLAIPPVYSVGFKIGRGQLSASDWAALSTNLNNGHVTGSWVKIRLTYDSSVAGDVKPWTPPGFQTFLCAGIGLAFGPNCG